MEVLALIKSFEGTEISMRQLNGRWGMTAEQFGTALGFAEPRKSVINIINRNREEVEPYLGVIRLMTTGGEKDTTLIFDQGILILAMLAKTSRAKSFRRWVADLLMDLKNGSKQVVEADSFRLILSELQELRARVSQPQDPKAMILASIANNLTSLSPSVQKIVVTTALSLPAETQATWTATDICDELSKMGLAVSPQKLGKVAGAYGIRCPREEEENEYGFWSQTTVNSFSKVVNQFLYRKPGRDRLISIMTAPVSA